MYRSKKSAANHPQDDLQHCLAPTRGFEPPTPRLGGECSILLSYVDMPIFWLKHWVFRQSAVAAVFMISDGFRRPETTDENFRFHRD